MKALYFLINRFLHTVVYAIFEIAVCIIPKMTKDKGQYFGKDLSCNGIKPTLVLPYRYLLVKSS